MYIQIDLVSRLTHTVPSLEIKQEEVLDTGDLCLRGTRTEKFKSSEGAADLSLTRHSGTLGSGDRCLLCRDQETQVCGQFQELSGNARRIVYLAPSCHWAGSTL